MSVTFCVGSVGAKRKAFLQKLDRTVTADNDDVLLCFRLQGKLYCAQGEIPFGNMTVREIVAYQCALRVDRPLSDGEIRYILRSGGLKVRLRKRLRTLSRVKFRHLQLITKLELDTTTVRLNFDGLDYTARNRRHLQKMLKTLSARYDVQVAVTDTRFIPPLAHVLRYDGDKVTSCAMPKVQTRPASRRRLLKEMQKRNLPLSRRNVKKIVYVRA